MSIGTFSGGGARADLPARLHPFAAQFSKRDTTGEMLMVVREKSSIFTSFIPENSIRMFVVFAGMGIFATFHSIAEKLLVDHSKAPVFSLTTLNDLGKYDKSQALSL